MAHRTYMFIAGDPSGDQHSAPVIKQLKKTDPTCSITGIGGPAMQEAGFKALFPFEPFNRMGFAEVIAHLPFFLNAKKKVIAYLRETPLDCLICVDYSGFNIPIMKAAHRFGIPVVWYIAPMVWAWKKKRAKVLAKYASHICCIFPFEVSYFTPYTKNVSFVGNPLVESMISKNLVPSGKTEPSENPVLAIIPGSRPQEIFRNVKPMIGAYHLLKKQFPNLSAVISRFPTISEETLKQMGDTTGITFFSGPLTDLLYKADIALVTSGTATLETALMGVPHVIVYKTSLITYTLFKHLVTISYIGLPNIIANELIAPECIQKYVTDRALAEAITPFLSYAASYKKTAQRLFKLRKLLGSKKPSHGVAEVIYSCLSP